METVKVDIQKLQLLNDRIAQTIEALNQVRMSATVQPHGSSWGYGSYLPVTFGQPFAQPTFSQPAFVQPSYPQQAFSPFQSGGGAYNPYMVSPFSTPAYGGIQHTSPMLSQQVLPQQVLPQQTPTGWTLPWTTGISHSTWEPGWQTQNWQTPTWQSPWQMRSTQSLPFVQYVW